MFHVERSLPVNPPGAAPLTRAEVWHGLLMKAETPVDFVPAISSCEIAERGEGWLVRDVVLRGEAVRERVTYQPEHTVTFERLSGSVLGTIVNEIVEDAEGTLSLRFAFDLEPEGIIPGSAEEADFAATMGSGYGAAVETTLATVRRLVAEGTLP